MESGFFIGMDEAGYGPNLGPLLLTATRWKTPNSPEACEFYKLLRGVVDGKSSRQGKRLHIADSKLVNNGKEGFRSLETSALALLECLGWETGSFHTLLQRLTANGRREPGNGLAEVAALPLTAPWFQNDLPLPLKAGREDIAAITALLKKKMAAAGLRLVDVQSDLVTAARFNDLIDDCGTKGMALSRLAFQLLRRVWSPAEGTRTLFVGDKHGGRNRYDELLAEVLEDQMIFRVEEGRDVSVYRVHLTELRFQVRGEAHLPVAAASIISKYLREVAMELFNAFWLERCPGLRATRGYPSDAGRFRREIEPARLKLDLDERILWRSR